jgi:hypothetical protein
MWIDPLQSKPQIQAFFFHIKNQLRREEKNMERKLKEQRRQMNVEMNISTDGGGGEER